MYRLENELLKIEIESKGAELKSVFGKIDKIEYIWPGTEGSFQKSAPNLFPFIGNIKNGEINYPYKGKRIILPMDKHGFVRDMEFELIKEEKDILEFQLKWNELLKSKYPYEFLFKVKYELKENILIQSYIVENIDEEPMFYHVGGHTAFNCEYMKEDKFEDYYLKFYDKKCIEYNMDKGGQFVSSEKINLDLEDPFKLYKKRFKEHAYVLDEIKNKKISLRKNNSKNGVDIEFDDFPLVTLWSSGDNSKFICLEPWVGTTDFIENSGKVEEKYLIEQLEPKNKKEYKQIMKFM